MLLKHVKDSVHPHEIGIGLDFSSESLASHPKNHHVPIYEILDVPDDDSKIIIVMPLLRKFKNSRIKSVGEAAEFFRRVFEVNTHGIVLILV